MPLVETLPMGPGCRQWHVWGTTCRVVVADPDVATDAAALVREELNTVDAACSRFRPDSETSRLAGAGGRPVRASRTLTAIVEAALWAADRTDGDVDPTLGTALADLGYDRDFARIRDEGGDMPVAAWPGAARWRSIHLDGDMLTIPAGVVLDLGATAKAWAADRCADLIARRYGVGALVALGGDIATAGTPRQDWEILVQDGRDQPSCSISVPAGAAVATSSTISRTWRRGSAVLHHVLDPRTAAPVPPIWRTASVVAASCLEANTYCTAALVRGAAAVLWLRDVDIAARLVTAGGMTITVGGWPPDGGDGGVS